MKRRVINDKSALRVEKRCGDICCSLLSKSRSGVEEGYLGNRWVSFPPSEEKEKRPAHGICYAVTSHGQGKKDV